jgi:chromate transporter
MRNPRLDENSIGSPAAGATPAPPESGARLIAIFVTFSKIGLTSFGGGVSVRAQEELTEDRCWLTQREFSAAFALARIVPGANIINLAALIGHRLRGVRGAVAAVLGLLVGPTLVVVGLADLAGHFGGATLDAALRGLAAAAAGLLISMGVRLGSGIVRIALTSSPRRAESAGGIAVLVAMVVLVGALRLPTALAVLCLAPVSSAIAFFAGKTPTTGKLNGGG